MKTIFIQDSNSEKPLFYLELPEEIDYPRIAQAIVILTKKPRADKGKPKPRVGFVNLPAAATTQEAV